MNSKTVSRLPPRKASGGMVRPRKTGRAGTSASPRGRATKFPVPKDMIHVMTEGWDGFTGSGFGHKCFVNDKQYYCWRGKEISKTVFEIAVSDGPLGPEEKRCLLPQP